VNLTTKRIAKNLKTVGRYGDGDGLYLQVNVPGRGSWILRYERNGRERAMGLGKLSDFSLAEARLRARAARQLLADGIDPLDQKAAQRQQQALEAARNITFQKCAELYFDAHAAAWSKRHRQAFTGSLRDYVYPIIGAIPVSKIDEPLVLKVLQPIWKDMTVTAKRVRNRIASVLDYAAASKYRTGTNPARWEGHLEHLLAPPEKIASVEHFPALPYKEIPAFIAELRKVQGLAVRALEFLILTAARSDEVRNAVWSEIDLEQRMWIIPAERMKKAREHRVPLSDRCIEILKALPREPNNPYVFIGAKSGRQFGDNEMYRLLRAQRGGVTVHGFRASFKTWAEESTAFSNHVIELSLAHSIGTATEKAYRRTDLFDLRRRLMANWAKHCCTPTKKSADVTPTKKPADVVPIRGQQHA
jgi:integrase